MSQRTVSVDRLPDDWQRTHCDLVIACVGYEKRARFICESYKPDASTKVAAGFSEQKELEYQSNAYWFTQNGYDVQEVRDDDYRGWIESVLHTMVSSTEAIHKAPRHILIDISCMSRKRMAHTIAALRGMRGTGSLIVDFVYALAAYSTPEQHARPNRYVGPITDEFAGWWDEPDRTLSAIVGLGYEQDKALGAVEYLQAQDVWLFEPVSEESRYTKALKQANQNLLKGTDSEHLFVYRLFDPLRSYSTMRSLVLGLSAKNNVVLLPFGPKLFVLYSLLIAADDPSVAVWRVSASQGEPLDAEAFGVSYGLRVTFAIPSDSPWSLTVVR
jgi:hypothetical protein